MYTCIIHTLQLPLTGRFRNCNVCRSSEVLLFTAYYMFTFQDIPPGHSPQWSYRSADGFSSSNPNTPAIAPTTPAGVNPPLDSASHSVEPTNAQPTLSAVSPQGPMDNELKKQASVSSLRDALLSTPNSAPQQQYSAYSPQVPGGHPSPMTPSTTFPHTPDASTPAGGSSIMSPHAQQQRDVQIPAESELINSFTSHSTEEEGRSLRVSPFQVESILGIRNDKPIDFDENLGGVSNSVDDHERNTLVSPGRITRGSKPEDDNGLQQQNENDSQPTSDTKAPVCKVDSLAVPAPSEDGEILQVCTVWLNNCLSTYLVFKLSAGVIWMRCRRQAEFMLLHGLCITVERYRDGRYGLF